jgi:hypothetical protein
MFDKNLRTERVTTVLEVFPSDTQKFPHTFIHFFSLSFFFPTCLNPNTIQVDQAVFAGFSQEHTTHTHSDTSIDESDKS